MAARARAKRASLMSWGKRRFKCTCGLVIDLSGDFGDNIFIKVRFRSQCLCAIAGPLPIEALGPWRRVNSEETKEDQAGGEGGVGR